MSIAGSEFWRGTILRRFFKSSTAVAAALVAMLVFTSAEAQAKTRALSNAERLIVEKDIKDTLVDPDSAKFEIKPLIVGSKLACGRFNSKNLMGCYQGVKGFRGASRHKGRGKK